MTYITNCKAPDISDLGATLFSRSTISLLFHGRIFPQSPVANRFLTGYLLVTDKAVREYTAGRELLIAYSTSSNVTKMLVEGLGRFETSISSTRRAFRFIDRLTGNREIPAINRTSKRLLNSYKKSIKGIRDFIEHIDEDIHGNDVLKPGMPHLLAINHDGLHLEIGADQLSLCKLAEVIRNLHNVGCKLLETLPKVKLQEQRNA